MKTTLTNIKFITLGLAISLSVFLISKPVSADTYAYIPLGGGSVVSNVNFSTSPPFQPGSTFNVDAYITWNSIPYSMQVSMTAQNNATGSITPIFSNQSVGPGSGATITIPNFFSAPLTAGSSYFVRFLTSTPEPNGVATVVNTTSQAPENEGDITGVKVNGVNISGASFPLLRNSSTTGGYTSGSGSTVEVSVTAANNLGKTINLTDSSGTISTQTYTSAGTYYFNNKLTDGRGITVELSYLNPPTVTTNSPITNITQTSASGGGNVTSQGGSAVTVSGIVWGTSSNPTTALSTKTTDGATSGSWSGSSITGLSSGTTYYVRAYATSPIGTAYGSNVSFTTASASCSNKGFYNVGTSPAGACAGQASPRLWSLVGSGNIITGEDLFTNSSCTTPLTGWSYIKDIGTELFNLSPGGKVGTDTGVSC